ncbi:hypothetical protein HG536_0C05140 [Torulaspora globosa]|uniref:Mitochondrial acidic protein MAM33 n=1 Tax=Torulaspora globosa TaxID=48254 RepID=A0A7G3ZFQ9_9SACH|nr:uncharacterized protein HG536_0C05140 [Torulaspora globosa]QLL32345.1 hypothetical protein HG536_0C05140 [Torulaspora globosa]
MSFRLASQVVRRNLPVAQGISFAAKRVLRAPVLGKVTVAQIQTGRSFATSTSKWNQQSDNVRDVLKSEIKVESEVAADNSLQSFQEFLDKFEFTIVESPGKNLAEITKKTENGETVHVFFDVAQVANLPYDSALAESAAQDGEAVNEEDYDSLSDNFANVNVVVVKDADQSAVSLELLMNLQEGSFYVDSVTPFKTAQEALDQSAEAEVKRELVYHGPPFSNLDEELQESLEVYLESRGVTEELASFIGAYSEFKENQEYIKWLNDMKKFFS